MAVNQPTPNPGPSNYRPAAELPPITTPPGPPPGYPSGYAQPTPGTYPSAYAQATPPPSSVYPQSPQPPSAPTAYPPQSSAYPAQPPGYQSTYPAQPPDYRSTYPAQPPGYPPPAAPGYPYPGQRFAPQPPPAQPVMGEARDAIGRGLQRMTGDVGAPTIRFGQLFSEVFARHSPRDSEALLVRGTFANPPGAAVRRPWLFSRIWLVLAIGFVILLACCAIFPDTSDNVVPGMIFFGAMTMPVAIMVFFWEINAPQNINLLKVIQIFFIGGAMAMLLTFIVDAVLSSAQDVGYVLGWSLVSATLTSIAEETAKIVAVYFFVRNLPYPWIMNGLLVGAMVGCGFAGFETMGYGLASFGDLGAMTQTLVTRGALAVGGHSIWTPIAGAALMRGIQAQRTRGVIGSDYRGFARPEFWSLFAVPLVLHLLWDFLCDVIPGEGLQWLFLAGLCAAGWVFVIRLVNSGLKEYQAAVGV